MLLTSLWPVAALAATALAEDTKDNPPGQSTFVSPGGDVAFALTVPDNDNLDIYFSLRVPKENSWGAVGLGSDDMRGALVLMIYRNERGDNVTFSPRVGHGNYEPQYYPDVEYEVLNGTGIFDDDMVFVAKCTRHCRSWPAGNDPGGYIDVSSPNQKAIYAVGPRQGLQSNSPSAAIKYHREYGVFTIDMKRTQGSADPPVLTKDSKNEGTTLDGQQTGKRDVRSALHAAFMIFFVVFMFPLGVVLLRLGRWARWHGLNQTVGMVGVLAGLVLGVLTSFHYQRSRDFRSYHQILGFILVGFILIQFSLGVLHHTQYRKTQAPTKFGRVHLWLGRIIIFVGTLNALFGFSFALNRKYGIALATLIVILAFTLFFFTVGRQFLAKGTFRSTGRAPAAANAVNGANTGYQPHPWRQEYQQAPASNDGSDAPPAYTPPQQIGLRPVSPYARSASGSSDAKDDEDQPQLGGVQRPREFA
ncbi:cellobiose dehydrogenase [Drechmeria coniospora]|uniref:Cellobiose dehydrogenase n=1 Tax=Drechmeria coniospora TaxID=98403 RepID=A0A151GTB8_DRECN|nr:cellobiose dehydrogenase [Drechmeria coniospora]KYK60303.1 cellobiose dehydrogenase [Drechmeria coniospora]